MNIIPRPNGTFEPADGVWKAGAVITVDCGGFDECCTETFAERAGVKLDADGGTGADIVLIKNPALAAEEYALEVRPEGVKIAASTEAGVIHALTTLFLCLTPGGAPAFSLSDSPRFAYRGLLLDCARHFFSVDEVKKVIEQISLAKINRLHWHLTDDQAWRVEIRAFPDLCGQLYYSQAAIKDIVLYAKKRGVEIVPELDMPGHTTAAIHAYPWLSCAGKGVEMPDTGGIFKTIMCAGGDSTYDFIFAVLDEITELFPSPHIHIGGDEAPKGEWEKCEACKKRLAGIGSEDFEDLQGYFTARVAEYLSAKGKSPVCWNDALSSRNLPRPLTVQYWMPGKDDEKARAFLRDGRPVIFSNMFHLYLDYPHALVSLKRVYDYEPAIGGALCEGALGLEACLWSERVDTEEKLEAQVFPRIFALAESAWSCELDYADFERRLAAKYDRLRKQGVFFTPPEDCNPTGEEKTRLLLEFIAAMSGAIESTDGNRVDMSEGFDWGFYMTQFGLDLSMFA